ncbi:MAG: twin-arginine translocation signal domain-containing protein, partial [Lachnospiraceae bacterium]|nr:twin-arginine translocation signal domain-containing protein [Lachnospiraceae bacterium]
MMRKISRRDFLKGSAAGAASLAVSSWLYNGGQGMVLAAEDESAAAGTGNVILAWENPEVTAKPAARNWYPDAGAGADLNGDGEPDYLDQVYDYITGMYEGGFGSVELTWLNTNSFFEEQYAAEIGWGTPAYCEIICAALDAANHCEDGFQIDVTITAHWPITINVVTPNDAAAAQSVVLADMQSLSAEDLEQEVLPLAMAETWLCDNANSSSGSGSSDSTYIFKDTLISSALAKLNDDGTVNMESLVTLGTGADLDVDGTAISTVDSWAVGIPGADVAYIEFTEDESGHHYWDLQAEAPEGAERNVSGTSSLVENDDYYDDRETMADTQIEYGVSTETIKSIIGDEDASSYVLLNSYYRGCGETCSGGATQMMEGKAYVTDYFCAEGADVVLDYWGENMLPYAYTTIDGEETTMADLMKANVEKCGGSSIFEDSIELNPKYTGGLTFWTANALNDFSEKYGYDVSKYVYVMMNTDVADDAETAGLIYNDFAQMMGDLYVQYHSTYINNYFNEAVGYKYRAQAYELDGMLDVGLAAMTCGFGESDNSTSCDADRLLAGANILSGGLYTTNEALTFGYDEYQVWRTELKAMNNLFSEGVSHIILHGSAFNRASALNTAGSAWPGWNFRMVFDSSQQSFTSGFMSWGP